MNELGTKKETFYKRLFSVGCGDRLTFVLPGERLAAKLLLDRPECLLQVRLDIGRVDLARERFLFLGVLAAD
jgi:hypothetical protein